MGELSPARRTLAVALGIFLLAGAALRIGQFAVRRSLWLDEAALAVSILARTPSDLIGRPLAYTQVAPPAFLLSVKGAVGVFGGSESALRLVPLVSGLLILPAFALVAWRLLAPLPAVVACGLLALNARLVYYSSELKQYSTECLATIVLLGIALRGIAAPEGRRGRWLIATALLTAVLGWFSYTSVLVAAGVLAALGIAVIRSRSGPDLRSLAVAAAIALLGVLPVTVHSMRSMSPRDREHMTFAWTGGFAPHSPRGLAVWLPKSVVEIVQYLTELSPVWIAVVLVLVVAGAIRLWRLDARVALCVLLPFAVALAAAFVRVYPFKGERLALYLLPIGLLLAGAGLDGIAALRGSEGLAAAGVLGAVLLFVVGRDTIAQLPMWREELRPVLGDLAQKSRPDDRIYVYYAAGPAFRYYRERIPIHGDVQFGGCHRDQWSFYSDELLKLSDRPRVWFVFSHSDVSVQGAAEAEFLLDCLTRSGRIDEKFSGTNARAFLWEPGPNAKETIARIAQGIPAEHEKKEISWACIAGPQGPYEDAAAKPEPAS